MTEQSDGSIVPYSGSFSGSGSPQREFGFEASRAMWRVLFDVALHTWSGFEDAEHFLRPVHNRLDAGYSPGINNWHEQTFMFCHGVNSIYNGWRDHAFIYAPVYSALVLEASGVPTQEQQEMIDTAGLIIDKITADMKDYARFWSIIGILTLNADVTKAGEKAVCAAADPTASPTASPTNAPSSSPTASPTASPSGNPTETPTDNPTTSPTSYPPIQPSATPSTIPTAGPSDLSSDYPTASSNSATPTVSVTSAPSVSISSTDEPSASPSNYACEENSLKEDCNDALGCSWRSSSGLCKIALSNGECSEWDGNFRKCKRKGCAWNRNKKICQGRWD